MELFSIRIQRTFQLVSTVLFIALCQKYIWTEFIISIHSSMIYPLYFADISSAFNFLVSSPFL